MNTSYKFVSINKIFLEGECGKENNSPKTKKRPKLTKGIHVMCVTSIYLCVVYEVYTVP